LIILSGLFLFFTNIKGQVTGYMGKKNVTGYGFYCNPAFCSIIKHYSDKPVNTLHELFLERATRRGLMWGVSAKFYRYTYNNIEAINWSEDIYRGAKQKDEHPRGTYEIEARNYSVYWKFFKTCYVAPWGKYFLLGLTAYDYKTTYDPGQMKARADGVEYSVALNRFIVAENYISDFGSTTRHHYSADVFFGNGKSRIFFNKIVLDYGYSIHLIGTMRLLKITAIDYVWNGDEKTYFIKNYIKETSSRRVAAINRFNLFFKLGYLF